MRGRDIVYGGLLACTLATAILAGQGPGVQALPRTPDGKPDLTGVYQPSSRRGPCDAEAPGDQPGQAAARATPVNTMSRDPIRTRSGRARRRRSSSIAVRST